jgi:hypothetical protein
VGDLNNIQVVTQYGKFSWPATFSACCHFQLNHEALCAIFNTSARSGPCRDFTIPAEKVNFSPAANDLPGGRWIIQTPEIYFERMPFPQRDASDGFTEHDAVACSTGAAKAFKQGHLGLRQTPIVGAAKHYFKV